MAEYIVLSVVFILAIGFSFCLAIGMADLTQEEVKKLLEEKHKHENID